jgi:hypothetical protein
VKSAFFNKIDETQNVRFLMNLWPTIKRPPWRTVLPAFSLLVAVWLGYWLWAPGLDVRDGRHDRGRNGIWLAHGWLGTDEWFVHNAKTNELGRYRDTRRRGIPEDWLKAREPIKF